MKINNVAINYQKFIEDNFQIINKEGEIVPFIFNPIQTKYYPLLRERYNKELEGIRELVLKARQHGISSLIEAIFSVDFLIADKPISSVVLAHKKDATLKLFNKVKFFIESACRKQGIELDDLLETNNRDEMRNKSNGATFFIATAGSKVGIRGTTLQNVHFSEVSFFGDTDIITAEETVLATLQTIKLGTGKVFAESTANGFGNWFQLEWQRAIHKQSNFYPTFFSFKENPEYTDNWIEKKKLEFPSEYKFQVEYPLTPEQAFLSSGNTFFDQETLHWLQKEIKREPIEKGYLAPDGNFI